MTEKYRQAYEELARIPEITSGKILNVKSLSQADVPSIKIEVHRQCRDLVSLKQQESKGHYLVVGDTVTSFPAIPTDPNVVLQSTSPSGCKTAQIVQTPENQKLLVTDDGSTVSIDLKKERLHGKVYCDPYISCLEWSSDELKVAFLAEDKTSAGYAFFNSQPRDADEVADEHLFFEDWGEQMAGQHQGVIVIVDVVRGGINVISLPGDVTPGQLVWRPGSHDVIGVAYPSKPYRIGIAYCSDRESFIFKADIHGNFEALTPRGQHVKSPRFSPSGETLVFLQSYTFGEWVPGAQLAAMTWSTKKVDLLIDYVDVPQRIKGQKMFMGVCGKTTLPKRCFDQDESVLFFSAFNLSNCVTYSIQLASKEISELTDSDEFCLALDVHKNWILLMKSSVAEPDRVVVQNISSEPNQKTKEVAVTMRRQMISGSKDWIKVWTFKSPIKDKEGKDLVLSALYFGPTEVEEGMKEKRPLICLPHGGPHSIIGNRFWHLLSFFSSLGYSVLLPNYRGSIGHGNDFLSASLGQCGDADVQDCFQSLDECFYRFGDVLDRSKIFLIGFSHGGLLCIHMATIKPNYFKAIATMNGVTDIYIMATVSDIPEWASLEFGLPFNLGRVLDGDAVTRMFERSPIKTVHKMKTPTLILLGKKDLRVPPSQGIYYYKMLSARNVPTRIYMYEDNHPLKKISSESSYLVEIAKWFHQYEK